MLTAEQIRNVRERIQRAILEQDWKEPVYGSAAYILVAKNIPALLSHMAEQDAEIARLREAERWIPVTERLPKDGERVLIREPWCQKDWLEVSTYEAETGFVGDTFTGYHSSVTHWRPLPHQPEGGFTK